MNLVELKQIKKLVAVGNRYDVKVINVGGLFGNSYNVNFVHVINGNEYTLCLQKRNDRNGGKRIFKTLDNAISVIKSACITDVVNVVI